MAKNYIADSSVLVALLSAGDQNHAWALAQAKNLPTGWLICEAVLTEAFFLVGGARKSALSTLLTREALVLSFDLSVQLESVLALMEKYSDLPMSLADGCLVRMSEILVDPIIITADTDFKIYRRHGRQTIPCLMP